MCLFRGSLWGRHLLEREVRAVRKARERKWGKLWLGRDNRDVFAGVGKSMRLLSFLVRDYETQQVFSLLLLH